MYNERKTMKIFIIGLIVGFMLTNYTVFAQETQTNQTESATVLKNRKLAKEIREKYTKTEQSKQKLKRTKWDMLQSKPFSNEWVKQKRGKKMEREGKDTTQLWKKHKEHMKNRRVINKQRKKEKEGKLSK